MQHTIVSSAIHALANAPKRPQDKTLTFKGQKIPVWAKAIPESQSHGSGTLQKRLWRLVSDYTRIRDWYKYKKCIATGKRIENWQDGQAGHFKSYSKCRGMFKFDERNIHLQSAQSNSWGDSDDWARYETELVRRWGINRGGMDMLNNGYPLKINDTMVIEKMRGIISKMKDLPEHPDYYERVLSLL